MTPPDLPGAPVNNDGGGGSPSSLSGSDLYMAGELTLRKGTTGNGGGRKSCRNTKSYLERGAFGKPRLSMSLPLWLGEPRRR